MSAGEWSNPIGVHVGEQLVRQGGDLQLLCVRESGGCKCLMLTGDIVPPARITHLAASTSSRKWLAGFSCWYLISTRSFDISAVKIIRPSGRVSLRYPVARERTSPSLGLASATRNASTVCKGGVTPLLVSR